jgi:hypothetical protein
MNITINIEALPIDEQKGLYLELRPKFEPQAQGLAVTLDAFLDLNLCNFRQELGTRAIKLLEEAEFITRERYVFLPGRNFLKLTALGKRHSGKLSVF